MFISGGYGEKMRPRDSPRSYPLYAGPPNASERIGTPWMTIRVAMANSWSREWNGSGAVVGVTLRSSTSATTPPIMHQPATANAHTRAKTLAKQPGTGNRATIRDAGRPNQFGDQCQQHYQQPLRLAANHKPHHTLTTPDSDLTLHRHLIWGERFHLRAVRLR